MKKVSFIIVAFLLNCSSLFSQVAVNTDGSDPHPSAGLDVNFNNKGFLPPRMNTMQMNQIMSPSAGLMVYNTTLNSICWFNGTSWDIGTNRDGQSCGTANYGGKTYNSVIIGMQCWMNENLNIGTAILGNQDQTDNEVIEKYCYDNNSTNCDIYGGLYQWAEMVQYLNGASNSTSWNPVPPGYVQGICPPGWYLPSNEEWISLLNYLGGWDVAGGKMKETGTAHWASPNTGATNSSGFTALPGGYRHVDGYFEGLTYNTGFWSASEGYESTAYFKYIWYNAAYVGSNSSSKTQGFSVRCLQK